MKKPPTDKDMILNPNEWPKWPLLPMIKRDGSRETGVIVGDPTKEKQVFFLPHVNLFAMKGIDTSKGMLIDVDELLAQGWKVD